MRAALHSAALAAANGNLYGCVRFTVAKDVTMAENEAIAGLSSGSYVIDVYLLRCSLLLARMALAVDASDSRSRRVCPGAATDHVYAPHFRTVTHPTLSGNGSFC